MTKREILEIFAHSGDFLTPDRIWLALQKQLDRRSVYSYLLRLKRQGLLETGPNTKRGHLAVPIDRAWICAAQVFSFPNLRFGLPVSVAFLIAWHR